MTTPPDPFQPPPGAQPPPLPPGYGPPAPGYGPPPPGYGQPPQWGQWQQPYPQQQGTNGLAIAALVCGILGGCFGVTGVVAIVLGVVALNQISQRGQQGKGLAIAGIVLGALWVVAIISLFVLGGIFSSSVTMTCETISTDGTTVSSCR